MPYKAMYSTTVSFLVNRRMTRYRKSRDRSSQQSTNIVALPQQDADGERPSGTRDPDASAAAGEIVQSGAGGEPGVPESGRRRRRREIGETITWEERIFRFA